MQETVIEEIIKIIFGEYWLIPAIIIVVAGAVIRFIYRNHLPMYFKGCLIICMIAIAVLAGSDFVRWDQYPAIKQIREIISPLLLLLIVIAMVVLFCEYRKNDRQLKAVIKNTKPYGNKIKAWKELQKIKTANLTSWQKRKYDKRRLYLRVVLGNMCGAEQELKKFENDKAFYHYMKAIILNFKGNHKDELEEGKLAEDYCDGDTEPWLHFQIIANRGVAYVGAGEYRLADDCFKRAIDFGRERNLEDSHLWLTTYYNYVFNQTRLNCNISIQECLDMLEGVKRYIDIEDFKQYLDYSDIVIELLRQKKADSALLDEIINQDFVYLINTNLTDAERCILEAATARMVCTGRLNPTAVVEKISKDITLFQQLPMPTKYSCMKEIDYMFRDLRGQIVEKNQNIKETVHWYIVNQAVWDLDSYRKELPSEAVYEICYCLNEAAGLLKYRPNQYDWNEFLKYVHTAQMLYKENELFTKSALCGLDIMDEALSELNTDHEVQSLYVETMKSSLEEIEKILPELMEHPILNEIYLRLSISCFAMDDIEKSKYYYEKFQKLGNFAIDHFTPWLRGKYSVISLYMFVIVYIETVDKIAEKDLTGEMPQVQEWFKKFHERNGYIEAVVLGRVLGGYILPICVETVGGERIPSNVKVGDIAAAWLCMPALSIKIKCNATLSGRLKGDNCVISKCVNTEWGYYNVNTIRPDIRLAIDHIAEMIKAELPDYLVSGEELHHLAEDSWFDKVQGGIGLS